MAYINSEKSASRPQIKAICKQYGIKATLSVRNHSTLCLNITEGPIDFLANAHESAQRSGSVSINVYWIKDHHEGIAREFLLKVREAMNIGNFDESDTQADYFHVGWYTEINVGKWNKPYKLTA
jgi:hypothetical protein